MPVLLVTSQLACTWDAFNDFESQLLHIFFTRLVIGQYIFFFSVKVIFCEIDTISAEAIELFR